jgi:glycine cleavage system aminomethyltransferase T
VRAQEGVAPQRQLRLLAIDSVNPDPGGGEPVLWAGKAVARLTSAAYGYTVNHSLGFAYLPAQIEPSEPGLGLNCAAAACVPGCCSLLLMTPRACVCAAKSPLKRLILPT